MYSVCIRNNQTGEERMTTIDHEWDDVAEHLWTSGNYACDCNLHLFFERAGDGEPELFSHKCGDSGYTVLYATLSSGVRVELHSELIGERSESART